MEHILLLLRTCVCARTKRCNMFVWPRQMYYYTFGECTAGRRTRHTKGPHRYCCSTIYRNTTPSVRHHHTGPILRVLQRSLRRRRSTENASFTGNGTRALATIITLLYYRCKIRVLKYKFRREGHGPA